MTVSLHLPYSFPKVTFVRLVCPPEVWKAVVRCQMCLYHVQLDRSQTASLYVLVFSLIRQWCFYDFFFPWHDHCCFWSWSLNRWSFGRVIKRRGPCGEWVGKQLQQKWERVEGLMWGEGETTVGGKAEPFQRAQTLKAQGLTSVKTGLGFDSILAGSVSQDILGISSSWGGWFLLQTGSSHSENTETSERNKLKWISYPPTDLSLTEWMEKNFKRDLFDFSKSICFMLSFKKFGGNFKPKRGMFALLLSTTGPSKVDSLHSLILDLFLKSAGFFLKSTL